MSLAPPPALGSVGVPPLPERARQSVSRGCKCQEALAQPPGDFCGGPWQTLVTEGLDRSHCGSSGIHSFARLGGFVAESVSVSVGVSVNVSVCVCLCQCYPLAPPSVPRPRQIQSKSRNPRQGHPQRKKEPAPEPGPEAPAHPNHPLNHASHLVNHPTSAGPLEAEPPEQSAKSPEPPAESRATAYSEALLTR